MDVKGKGSALDVATQPALLFSLRNGAFQAARLGGIFAANINIAFARAAGISTDCHAFENLMRINIDQESIFEDERLGFVRVAEDVFLIALGLGNKTPLASDGKTGSAAPLQPGGFHQLQNCPGVEASALLNPA